MKDINATVRDLLQARKDKADAERREKAAAEAIKLYAAGAGSFSTDNYNVILSQREQFRLDTARLYADFTERDIKAEYGKVTRYVVIVASEKADAREVSA